MAKVEIFKVEITQLDKGVSFFIKSEFMEKFLAAREKRITVGDDNLLYLSGDSNSVWYTYHQSINHSIFFDPRIGSGYSIHESTIHTRKECRAWINAAKSDMLNWYKLIAKPEISMRKTVEVLINA